MTYDEIMEVAEQAAECNFTSTELKPSYAKACNALISAAELLKQVVVVKEGELDEGIIFYNGKPVLTIKSNNVTDTNVGEITKEV